MKVISHRGYWKKAEEKNTEVAFRRSFELGFGTETDVRDLNGLVVISHDPPSKKNVTLDLHGLLSIYREYDQSLTLALNVKSDGLQELIKDALNDLEITNYVLFDMSTPDAVLSMKSGLKYLTRLSDLECDPVLLDKAEGVWLDEFFTEWVDADVVRKFLALGKKVFYVSPELHGRPPDLIWKNFLTSDLRFSDDFIICTDRPEDLTRALQADGGGHD